MYFKILFSQNFNEIYKFNVNNENNFSHDILLFKISLEKLFIINHIIHIDIELNYFLNTIRW